MNVLSKMKQAWKF